MPLRRGCWGITWLPTLLILLCFESANSIPAKLRPESEFKNGFGSNYKGFTHVTGIPFSVEQNGTVEICYLSFSTDLEIIESASVSCRSFYDNVGQPVEIGLYEYEWIFYANIDDEIQSVWASIKFNPTTEVIYVLVLCFDSTCAAQETVMAASPTVCDCETETSSSAFYSSEPEGFVFVFASEGGGSSSSGPVEVTGEPFAGTTVTGEPFIGTTTVSSGLAENREIVDENFISQKTEYPHSRTSKKSLGRSLCLRYPPSSSSSSSSSSFSSSSPTHSGIKYVSTSYVSYKSPSSSSSSSSPNHSPFFSISSSYISSSSSSSSSSRGCPLFVWSSSSPNDNPWSGISYSSSVPEGFVLNFGSEGQTSSSSSSALETTTTTTMTTTTTTSTTTTTTTAQATNSQGSVI